MRTSPCPRCHILTVTKFTWNRSFFLIGQEVVGLLPGRIRDGPLLLLRRCCQFESWWWRWGLETESPSCSLTGHQLIPLLLPFVTSRQAVCESTAFYEHAFTSAELTDRLKMRLISVCSVNFCIFYNVSLSGNNSSPRVTTIHYFASTGLLFPSQWCAATKGLFFLTPRGWWSWNHPSADANLKKRHSIILQWALRTSHSEARPIILVVEKNKQEICFVGTFLLAVPFIFTHLAVLLAVAQPLEWDAQVVVALELVVCAALLTASL